MELSKSEKTEIDQFKRQFAILSKTLSDSNLVQYVKNVEDQLEAIKSKLVNFGNKLVEFAKHTYY